MFLLFQPIFANNGHPIARGGIPVHSSDNEMLQPIGIFCIEMFVDLLLLYNTFIITSNHCVSLRAGSPNASIIIDDAKITARFT